MTQSLPWLPQRSLVAPSLAPRKIIQTAVHFKPTSFGTLTILVGGVVVVTLLVFTVALMVRHRVCSNYANHHEIGEEVGCSGTDSPPLLAKGTDVFSQSNGNGNVMMVVLPNGLVQNRKVAEEGWGYRPNQLPKWNQKPSQSPRWIWNSSGQD